VEAWAPRGGLTSRIAGIIFDTADVLYDDTLWRRRLWQMAARLGVRAEYARWFEDWDEHYLPAVYCGRREPLEALHAFLLSAGLSWAQIDEIAAHCLVDRRRVTAGLRPLPGVVATIARLTELGIPLVAWADAAEPAGRLAERLDRLGLAGRFRACLTSLDLEAAQPDPRCYQAAIESLHAAAGDTLYVGHDPRHLAGAQRVGLVTVAFNHAADAVARYQLEQFADLVDVAVGGGAVAPR
jgi:FMN phosphatase YigB (HAD superfamily)